MYLPRTSVLIVGASALWLLASGVFTGQTPPPASSPPQQMPLLQGGDLRYLGKFSLPKDDGRTIPISYGGNALGIGADGTSLYHGCIYGTGVTRVKIPDIGVEAQILEPCATVKNLQGVNPDDPNNKLLGGVLSWNGRVIVSGYSYYDGAGSAVATHFAGPSIARATGPYRVGNEKPAFAAGYMGVIPQEWRAPLGGPAFTGQCCISIISRTSYGPSVSVFDPDHVGTRSRIPGEMLVGYPQDHPNLGDYGVWSPFFSGATQMGGIAFPSGTRSVLFFGRHGSTYCYGEGTTDPALDGKPIPGTNGQTIYCYDPTDDAKGTHGYPYKHMVWAYDAVDLVAVKQGRKSPWDVRPYATWTLTEMSGGVGNARIAGAVYDSALRRVYITFGGNSTDVHVYDVGAGSASSPIADACGDGLDNDGDGLVDEDCDEHSTGARAWAAPHVLSGSGVASAALAACGDSVHVAQGNGALYYRRSTTEGATWNEWQQLGDGAIPSGQALACHGAIVVLTSQRGTHEVHDGQGARPIGDLWTWVSQDGGATWRAPLKISAGAAAGHASSAVDADRVATTWMQRRGDSPGTWDVHYRESGDRGETWSTDLTLASGRTPAGAAWPTVALGGGAALAAWTEARSDDDTCAPRPGASLAPCTSVVARRLVKGTWLAEERLDAADAAIGAPGAVLEVGAAALVYASPSGATSSITVAHSHDPDTTWATSARLSTYGEGASQATLAAGPFLLVAAWQTPRNGRVETVLRVSTDAGATWSGEESPLAGSATCPLVAVSRHYLHVVATGLDDGALHYARRAAFSGA